MDDEDILKLLKQKAENKILAAFVEEIFMYEFSGLGNWNNEYDKFINKFVKKEID